MDYYVIPARRNSKGLPFKNRKLYKYTENQLLLCDNVILTTDDEYLIEHADARTTVVERPDFFAQDETSTKTTLLHLLTEFDFKSDDRIIMLYLTYPQRTRNDIERAKKFFDENNAKSMLCRKDIKGVHPYLMLFEKGDNRGKQLVEHNLYRRQTYPAVFELSHFIFISKVSEIPFLNNNLYNKDTVYFPIDDVVDIDTNDDMKKFLNG